VIFVPSETSEDTPLLLENLDQTFFGDAQLQSADSRLRLGANARDLIGEQPVIGWGFGKQVVLERPFGFDPVNVPAHNIVYDIGIRSGLLGIGLAAVALLASLADALRIWRGHDDPVIAAFAMACAAALIGLLAKGLVESILENFRLAATLGMLLGCIAAARRSVDQSETEMPHRDLTLHRRSAAAISRVLAL
jgi:O-antigen ligase